MPLSHQDSKNHKEFIMYNLHLVKLHGFIVFVAKNGFSEGTKS